MSTGDWTCPLPHPLTEAVTLSHGAGGKLSADLVDHVFLPAYGNDVLAGKSDSGEFACPDVPGRLAVTTDAFVVQPLFFPGGDLGSLAVYGTLNDLAVQGAEGIALTAAWIIEEGFSIRELRRLAESVGKVARECGIRVIAADTKVIERIRGDGCYLTTSGVGWIRDGIELGVSKIRSSDCVLLSGSIAEHGMAVMAFRDQLAFHPPLESDCSSLWSLIEGLLRQVPSVRVMRDPTRGGIAASLNEFATASNLCFRIQEDAIPIRPQVRRACELLGIDPWVVANEGKVLLVVAKEDADRALEILRAHPMGRESAVIGFVDETFRGRVVAETRFKTQRVVPMPTGELLPRIC